MRATISPSSPAAGTPRSTGCALSSRIELLVVWQRVSHAANSSTATPFEYVLYPGGLWGEGQHTYESQNRNRASAGSPDVMAGSDRIGRGGFPRRPWPGNAGRERDGGERDSGTHPRRTGVGSPQSRNRGSGRWLLLGGAGRLPARQRRAIRSIRIRRRRCRDG